MTKEQWEIDNRIKVLCSVKDRISIGAYSNRPGYKWLNERWSNSDILGAMVENNLKTTKETLEYLESIAHLFGQDR